MRHQDFGPILHSIFLEKENEQLKKLLTNLRVREISTALENDVVKNTTVSVTDSRANDENSMVALQDRPPKFRQLTKKVTDTLTTATTAATESVRKIITALTGEDRDFKYDINSLQRELNAQNYAHREAEETWKRNDRGNREMIAHLTAGLKKCSDDTVRINNIKGDLETTTTRLQIEIDVIKDTRAKLRTELEEKETEIVNLRKELDDLDAKLKKNTDERATNQKDLEKCRSKVTLLLEKLKAGRKEKNGEMQSKISSLETKCLTEKGELRKTISQLETSLTAQKAESESIASKLKLMHVAQDTLTREKNKLTGELKTIRDERQKLTNEKHKTEERLKTTLANVEELQALQSTRVGECEMLKERLDKLRAEHSDELTALKLETAISLNNHDTAMEELDAARNILSKQLDEKTAELEEKNAHTGVLKMRLEEVTLKENTTNDTVTDLRIKVSQLEYKIIELNDQIKKESERFASEKTNWDNKFHNARVAQENKHRAEMATLKVRQMVNSGNEKIRTMEGLEKEHDAKIKEMRRLVSEQERKIEELTDKMVKESERVASEKEGQDNKSLDTQNKMRNAHRTEIEKLVNEQGTKTKEMQRRVDEHKKDVSSCREEITTLKRRLKELETKMTTTISNRDVLLAEKEEIIGAKTKEMQRRVDEHKKDVSSRLEEIMTLNRRLKELEASKASMTTTISNQGVLLAEKKGIIETLENTIKDRDTQLDELRVSHKETNDVYEGTIRKLRVIAEEREQVVRSGKDTITTLDTEIQGLRLQKEKDAEQCKQTEVLLLKYSQKEKACQSNLKNLRREHDIVETWYSGCRNQLQTHTVEVGGLKTSISRLSKRNTDIKSEMDIAKRMNVEYENVIARLKQENTGITEELSKCKTSHEKFLNDKNVLEEEVRDLRENGSKAAEDYRAELERIGNAHAEEVSTQIQTCTDKMLNAKTQWTQEWKTNSLDLEGKCRYLIQEKEHEIQKLRLESENAKLEAANIAEHEMEQKEREIKEKDDEIKQLRLESENANTKLGREQETTVTELRVALEAANIAEYKMKQKEHEIKEKDDEIKELRLESEKANMELGRVQAVANRTAAELRVALDEKRRVLQELDRNTTGPDNPEYHDGTNGATSWSHYPPDVEMHDTHTDPFRVDAMAVDDDV